MPAQGLRVCTYFSRHWVYKSRRGSAPVVEQALLNVNVLPAAEAYLAYRIFGVADQPSGGEYRAMRSKDLAGY